MNNPKKLWETLKHAAPTKSISSTPSFTEIDCQQIIDPVTMANTFNEHFYMHIQSPAKASLP